MIIKFFNWIKWRVVGYFVILAGILHLVATFVPAYFSGNPAYARLTDGLARNVFVVLPAARPGVQVIPFQQPDTFYGICNYDLSEGMVEVGAVLLRGWTLSIYDRGGVSIYDVPGRAEGGTTVAVRLVPAGGYFLGRSVLEKTGESVRSDIVAPSRGGMVVIRGPRGGAAYASLAEQAIRSATCSVRRFGKTVQR